MEADLAKKKLLDAPYEDVTEVRGLKFFFGHVLIPWLFVLVCLPAIPNEIILSILSTLVRKQ
jgi:hypothetical protein